MSGNPNGDRRSVRRQETKAEIVSAAWQLVGEHGLAGLSMRDLGERVGMRAQSIYSYFSSKHEIYDAMFLEGYQAFVSWMDAADDDELFRTDPVAAAQRIAHQFVDFCTDDPARHQLLFQRTIPGFEPSEESYAVALAALDRGRQRLVFLGAGSDEALDLFTAMVTGLADQQISNDPGGDRWKKLIDRAVEIVLAGIAPHLFVDRPDRMKEHT